MVSWLAGWLTQIVPWLMWIDHQDKTTAGATLQPPSHLDAGWQLPSKGHGAIDGDVVATEAQRPQLPVVRQCCCQLQRATVSEPVARETEERWKVSFVAGAIAMPTEPPVCGVADSLYVFHLAVQKQRMAQRFEPGMRLDVRRARQSGPGKKRVRGDAAARLCIGALAGSV